MPKLVGGNIVITINEDEYVKGLEDFIRCLIGRLVLAKGDKPISTPELKVKLSGIWKLNDGTWMLNPLGKGFFNMDLRSNDVKNVVFARGSLFLKPRVF